GAGADAVYAAEIELVRPLDAEAGESAVARIAEVDGAVRVDDDVVRRVELLALVVRCDRLARSVGMLANYRARHVLADEQVEVGVVRHALALLPWPHDLP